MASDGHSPKTPEAPSKGLESPTQASIKDAIVLEKLHEVDAGTLTGLILRSADDHEFRSTFLPQPSNRLDYLNPDPEVIQFLLALRKGAPDPARFTHIPDWETYVQALCAFPLILSHPSFDVYHRRVRLYFQVIGDPALRSWTLVKPGLRIQISKTTFYSWIKGRDRPKLLGILEARAAFIPKIRFSLAKHLESNNGIRIFQDISDRIKTFVLHHHLLNHPEIDRWLKAAERYLTFLQLIGAGYHPRDVEFHLKLKVDEIARNFHRLNRPYLIRLVSSIPATPPNQGLLWLPTATENRVSVRWIQVPPRITDYKQLHQVLLQLPTLDNPDVYLTKRLRKFGPTSEFLDNCARQFGSVLKIDDRLLALAYIAGVSLSDGSIGASSVFTSIFQIALSTTTRRGEPNTWSKGFGDRVAYYLTCIGFPTKPGKDIPPGKASPNAGLTHTWCSSPSAFLTWFNEAVLGLPPRGNHTYNPAKMDWILGKHAPRELKIRFIQGLFDGDGHADPGNLVVSVAVYGNTDFVSKLLFEFGIETGGSKHERLGITEHDSLQSAVGLPVFLSATTRQEKAEKVLRMLECTRSKGPFDDLPVIRYVQELGKDADRAYSEIREMVFDKYQVTLVNDCIQAIIKGGDKRLKIDQDIVDAFFHTLNLHRRFRHTNFTHTARKVLKETGVDRSLRAVIGWLDGQVPEDVSVPSLMDTLFLRMCWSCFLICFSLCHSIE